MQGEEFIVTSELLEDDVGAFVHRDCLVVIDNLFIGGEGGAVMVIAAEDEAGEESYAEE